MKRAIVVPAILPSIALDDLKSWLGITTSSDDAVLIALLHASLDLCEAFTGQMALEASCEEIINPSFDWQRIATRPVLALTGIEHLAVDGSRYPVPSQDYAFELDSDGSASVRLLRLGNSGRLAIRFSAGMTANWTHLPDGLRQGVLRLAAYHYRQRDEAGTRSTPPAAIAALWQPWRRMRLL